ncbi:MAG TPA: Hint domain-containing protein [Candidatus Babeliales bacterium]|nr:Hint domain-containing protein [Candidatus Babeliales bacterium]
MKLPIITRFLYIVFITCLHLHIILQGHGFCEHTLIKSHDTNRNGSIFSICRRAVKGKKIYIPSYDTHTHTYTSHKKVKRGGQSNVPWHIRFSCSGSDLSKYAIVCSPTQEFYCADTNRWVPAYTFHVGDRLLSYHGSCTVTYLEYIEKELHVYALEVELPHTFFVGHDKLLTHNMALPTSWIAPIATFGSGTVLSVGSGAAIGATLAPFLAPVVITAGLVLSGALSALVKSCNKTIPTYHTAVSDIFSFFGNNQEDQNTQNIRESNQPSHSPNGGPKKNDDKDKEDGKIKFPENENDIKHIFRNKENHIPKDTPEARSVLEKLVNDQSNYQGSDKFGTRWFSKIMENGEQLWAKVGSNNRIKNAGINKIPKSYDSITGLCRSLRITKL